MAEQPNTSRLIWYKARHQSSTAALCHRLQARSTPMAPTYRTFSCAWGVGHLWDTYHEGAWTRAGELRVSKRASPTCGVFQQ